MDGHGCAERRGPLLPSPKPEGYRQGLVEDGGERIDLGAQSTAIICYTFNSKYLLCRGQPANRGQVLTETGLKGLLSQLPNHFIIFHTQSLLGPIHEKAFLKIKSALGGTESHTCMHTCTCINTHTHKLPGPTFLGTAGNHPL